MPIDLIRRFAPTPHAAILNLNGMSVRVATNDPSLLDRLRLVRSTDRGGSAESPVSQWTIVVEEDDASDRDFAFHSFAHDGLSLIRLAQGSFLACDRLAHRGISFIDQSLIQDKQLFLETFLPAFMTMLEDLNGGTALADLRDDVSQRPQNA